jgi:hypothetical protein
MIRQITLTNIPDLGLIKQPGTEHLRNKVRSNPNFQKFGRMKYREWKKHREMSGIGKSYGIASSPNMLEGGWRDFVHVQEMDDEQKVYDKANEARN